MEEQTSYVPTIGLEIHAELKTNTKMFCSSKNDPDESNPNVNICPVCLAHPGVLPVINGEAVRHVLRVGIALGSNLADYTEFDRKNYFYPDLPKGYQLSQFDFPLVSGGTLADVSITRVHLEEDTASSIHDEATGATSIDYNRAGVPLMELVTDPVITSSTQAGNFARELQLLLRTLGVSNANMEKGEMRVEANVSVARKGERSSAYVEIKNLNSFRTMERAIEFEITRQTKLLEDGGTLVKQTLGWDEKKQATFPQRSKEGSADYRYFPDPDLPSLKLSELKDYSREVLVQTMPELPSERRTRYQSYGAKSEDAELFVRDSRLGSLFEASVESFGPGSKGSQLSANYIANDLPNLIRDIEERDTQDKADMPISAQHFITIIKLLEENKVSSRSGKDLLKIYAEGEKTDPNDYVAEHGLLQESSSDKLKVVVEAIIDRNPSAIDDFKAGKAASLEYLLGQCMRELRGAADPIVLRSLIKETLEKNA